MKAYTDFEQSKKLAKILPIESADGAITENYHCIPCWSLSALLNYLREVDFFPEIDVDEFKVTMSITYFNDHEARHLTPVRNITVEAESFIDACVEMIVKLHEQKLL